MIDPEILQVTLLVTDTLDQLQIPYVIGGSIASIVHGMVRTTMDADIVANLEAKHVSLHGVFLKKCRPKPIKLSRFSVQRMLF